jgi:hypothetical protein
MMRLGQWKLPILLVCVRLTAHAQEVEPATGWRRSPPKCPAPPPRLPDSIPMPETEPNDPSPLSGPNAFNEALASAGEGGTQPVTSYAPGFFGDFLGAFGTKVVNTGGQTRFALAPLVNHAGGIKVTDNESPRPVDRVYYSYDFFSFVNFSSNTNLAPMELHRHIFGFEKTFFDGFVSIGLRLPLVELFGPPPLAARDFADMTVVTKMAIWNDRATGNLVSAGLLISLPTGPAQVLVHPGSGNQMVLRDTILQPFVGYIWSATDDLYIHGFCAVAVPTDSKDATLMWNDLGAGYWLYRNDGDVWIRAAIPTIELHVNTPLNHRGKQSLPIGVSDVVDLTMGGYLVLRRGTLGGALGVPLTGPKPFGVEALGQYTLRF